MKDNKYKDIIKEKIIVRAGMGNDIGECIKQSLQLSLEYDTLVELFHNEVSYICDGNSILKKINADAHNIKIK